MDYYEVLGVPKNASLREIKSAYRKLAKIYHPDISPGDKQKEDKFRLIKEAYEVLSDREKREAYDRFGTPIIDDGKEFFESVFVVSREKRGEDIVRDVQILPQQKGGEVRIPFERMEICPLCQGKGTLSLDNNWRICPTCDGKGKRKQVKWDLLSEHITYDRCPDCQGRGKLPSAPCPRCEGKGRVKRREEITVKVPLRLRKEQKLVLKGLGNECPEGKKGDLIILFHIAEELLKKEV